ncbi:MAG TPA: TonB-dependent receptor [Allosphingosinicella sp.]
MYQELPRGRTLLPASCALAAILVAASPARAQRANENATRQAQDAFGFSVGSEIVGLYNAGSVRGFNPSAAGNIRIDGLYLAQQVELTPRIIGATTVRVGLNTVETIFPAPSGVVEHTLRSRGAGDVLSVRAALEPFVSPVIELDGAVGAGAFSVAGGARLSPGNTDFRGNEVSGWSVGMVPRWKPSESFELTGIFERAGGRREIAPAYSPGGPFLPPAIQRGVYFGQDWAVARDRSSTTGLIASMRLSPEWTARAGLFRSVLTVEENHFDLYRDVQPDGSALRTIILYPEQQFRSISGEAQLERKWTAGEARHTLTFAARGRRSDERYGGGVAVDFGPDRIDRRRALPRPETDFPLAQHVDRVEQLTGGASYRLELGGSLQATAGLQRTRYRKTFAASGGAEEFGESSPWLYNGLVAWRFNPNLIAYASYSRGMEESGIAPNNAVNRGEILPAIITTQREVGVRAVLGPIRLTTTAFDVRKPYASLDAGNTFGFVGSVRHRGIETSVAGQPLPGLSIVVGALLLDAQVLGEQREAGLIGKRPVTTTPFEMQASADYQLPFLEGASIDVQIGSFAPRTARRDNAVDIPARTLFNLGARYRFSLAGHAATLRGQVLNLFDKYGPTVGSGELLGYNAQRRARLALAVDF